MRIYHKLIIILILVLVPAAANLKNSAGQQPGLISWSEEIVIYEKQLKQGEFIYPDIVADPYGLVHVFLNENDTIYYLQKNGPEWSLPIDIVYQPGIRIQNPSAAIDQKGVIHLIWMGYGNIYYKSVNAWQANQVKNWAQERIIGRCGGTSTPIRIGVDENNGLHTIFSDWYGLADKTIPGNVYHFSSPDGGKTWSEFDQISNVTPGELATNPRMAFDGQGRVHIVWGEMAPDLDGRQQGVYYARLSILDHGVSGPKAIAQNTEDFSWITAINAAVSKDDDIFAVWTCGENQARRCSAYSIDGGESWTPPKRIFGELLGISTWDALFVDGAGILYWMGVLRYPQAMYYSPLTNFSFSDPPEIASQDSYSSLGEKVMVAIGLGNEVHAVTNWDDKNKIVYLSGITSAEKEPVLLLPTAIELSSDVTQTTDTQALNPQVEPSPTEISTPLQSDPILDLSSGNRSILVSVLAVSFTLALVFGANFLKRRSA